ncbi:hypothetical protein ACUOFC_66885, partial [Escherichia sp. TWPC-MK]
LQMHSFHLQGTSAIFEYQAYPVDWLKIYNLPGKPDIQISQMFPADALVSSPRAEKARLYSAIEQRLEQSLKIMD